MRVVGVLLMCACGNAYVPEPTISVLSLIGDGTTGVVDDGGLRLGFALDGTADLSWASSDPTSTQISAVASGTSVTTWPEGDAVPTATVPNQKRSLRVEIAVVPTVPLSPRWYSIALPALPPDTKRGQLPHFAQPDGGVASLFHVGPAPQLWGYAAFSAKGSLSLEFTEPVERPGDGSGIVSVLHKGSSVACHVGEMPGEMPNPNIPGLEFAKVRDAWAVRCPSAFDPMQSLTVTIGAGFHAPSGETVAGLPLTDTFVPSSGAFCGTSCSRRFVFATRGPQ